MATIIETYLFAPRGARYIIRRLADDSGLLQRYETNDHGNTTYHEDIALYPYGYMLLGEFEKMIQEAQALVRKEAGEEVLYVESF